MKNFKYLAIAAFAATSLTFVGCSDDYLDIQPTESISAETVASSLDNLYMAVNGIQRKLVSQDPTNYGSQGIGGEPAIGYCLDAQSDDLNFNSVRNSWHRTLQRWTDQANPSNTYTRNIWWIYYQRILNANLILQEVDNYADTGGDLYKQVKAEALAFRAHSHFQLVQIYGKRYVKGGDNSNMGVPYRTEPTTDPMARNTVEEVYRNVNADLDEAIRLMDGTKLKVDDYNHFNYGSLCGIKARVALAQQEYATAAEYADKAITFVESRGGKLMEASEISACPTTPIFANITSSTKEPVWAAMTQDDQTIYFYSFYAYMSWNNSTTAIREAVRCINSNLYDTMSETDLRRDWWDPTGEMEVPLTSFKKDIYQNRKFTARSVSDRVGDYAFMRLAELYLVKAEGLARSGQTAAAQEVFTKFQVTRDPAYVASASSADELIQEIMNSRWIELWGEGFNWLDHKRLGMDVDRTNSNFDAAICVVMQVPASDPRWQWAIPKAEVDANNLLVQNPI